MGLSPTANVWRVQPMLIDQPQFESENAALAARCFGTVGKIVFLFQFVFVAADRSAMPGYQRNLSASICD